MPRNIFLSLQIFLGLLHARLKVMPTDVWQKFFALLYRGEGYLRSESSDN
ncbi:MAG: hypothetical protein V4485_04055 [Pseudomonadota bacterium]